MKAVQKGKDVHLENVVDFVAMLKREAKSQEELDLIKRYAQTISDM